MKLLSYAMLCFSIMTLTACERIAVMMTPQKQSISSQSQTAKQAKNYFWQILHQGRYQDISRADYLLMAAYLENPNDPKLAAQLGFLHIWKLTERDRSAKDPLITNEIILAKKYFSDALMLDPANPIYEGFLGDTQLIEGQIFHDKREEVEGYFTLKRAIAKWPQFNYFTAGYPMSTLSPTSTYYKEALKHQWLTLDLCAGTKINRKHPDFRPFMTKETTQGPQRACWSSWTAPYNFSGFFMNMGDMLVKAGDWKTAIQIYKNAKLASNYSSWPFREMLEKRIIQAQENVSYFNQENASSERSIMFNSGHGCMACHQQGIH